LIDVGGSPEYNGQLSVFVLTVFLWLLCIVVKLYLWTCSSFMC